MLLVMLTVSLEIAVTGIFQVLLLGLCGYVLYKRRVVSDDGLGLLSRLLINVFLPAFIFHHLVTGFSFEVYQNWWHFPLFGFGLVGLAWMVSRLALVFVPDRAVHKEITALICFHNATFIPMLLVAKLFTDDVAAQLYVYIFLLLIGFNALIWTLGVWLLAGRRGNQLVLTNIFNPPAVTMVVTLGVIASGISRHIPGVILEPCQLLGQCVLPVALLIIGGNLARVSFRTARYRDIAVVVIAKQLLVPLVVIGILRYAGLAPLTGLILVIQAVMPSAITLGIIPRYYQLEERVVSHGVFFTHITSVITVPLFLYLYTHWLAR